MIISPDLVIFTILISVQGRLLSFMFMCAIYSFHPSSLVNLSVLLLLLLLLLLLGMLSRINTMRTMLQLFLPSNCGDVWETLKNIAAQNTARNGLPPKKAGGTVSVPI